ncbi:MAG: hypothetical protein WAL29_09290, partial [Bacteroidales bacterium]
MKSIKITGLIVLLTALTFNCEEEVKDPAGRRGAAAVPVISDIGPGVFASEDLVNSYVEFVVSPGDGVVAEKAIIEGSYNNNGARVELTEVTSFPATIHIVSGETIQALGLTPAEVDNGDVFNLEILLTAGGTATRSNAVLNVRVACGFVDTKAIGSYHSLSGPDDWVSEGNITITANQDDPYTIYVAGLEALEGVNEDGGPLVMHIDPGTFEVTADYTVLASEAFGFHNLAYAGSGIYDSCDGSYQMDFDISVDE